MKHPNLPANHCANQSPEMVRKIFVQSIAPRLKGGSMDARSAISELEGWRKYHPEVFADWENLCWKYLQQPPEWVNWLIQGVKATSDTVTNADELVAAACVGIYSHCLSGQQWKRQDGEGNRPRALNRAPFFLPAANVASTTKAAVGI
jgi:hypothetical protein